MDAADSVSQNSGGHTSKPKVSSSQQSNLHICKVLYLFSGTPRKGSVAHWIRKLSKKFGCQVEVTMIDIKVKPHWDLTKKEVQQRVVDIFRLGDSVIATMFNLQSSNLVEQEGSTTSQIFYPSSGTSWTDMVGAKEG